jgi:drug/metabolite transporter (DMT)-like permease
MIARPRAKLPSMTATTATPARRAPDWRVHAALVMVQVAFASQTVEGKILMGPSSTGGEGVSPFAVAMVRMLGATLFFQAFTRATRTLRPATLRDHGWLAVLSILGIVLNQTLFLVGLRMTSPVNAALLSVTIPVFTAAIAVALGQERASWRLGIGLAISIAGVAWLTGVGSVDRGALVVLANCVSYAFYIVLSRATIQRLGTLTVVTWIFTWGALLFAPVGLPDLVAGVASWTPRAWGLLAYIVAMPTIVAYLCNAWALERSTPTLVSVYIYVQPVLAALLAWVQLGSIVSERLAVAALVIAAGVTLVATRRDAVAVPMEE